MIVYPEGFVLSHVHFADGESDAVNTEINTITMPKDHEKNPFSKEINLMYLYWDVAFKFGGIRTRPDKVDKKDVSKMF